MSRSTTGPRLLLTGAGVLFVLVGVAGVYAGLALALGAACLLAGAVHLGLALALRRAGEVTLVMGIVVCAVMSVLALGWAVTALVSAASGSAPAVAMLPAGIGLVVLTAAYAWAGATLIRARRRPGEPV